MPPAEYGPCGPRASNRSQKFEVWAEICLLKVECTTPPPDAQPPPQARQCLTLPEASAHGPSPQALAAEGLCAREGRGSRHWQHLGSCIALCIMVTLCMHVHDAEHKGQGPPHSPPPTLPCKPKHAVTLLTHVLWLRRGGLACGSTRSAPVLSPILLSHKSKQNTVRAS